MAKFIQFIKNKYLLVKKILIFPASQRKNSINQHLACELARLLSAENNDVNIDFLSADHVDLPLFNQDLEQDETVLEKVIPLYQRFLEADALLVITPEYNGSFSPYLKNTIDWVSRIPRLFEGDSSPFLGKPLLLASATPGQSGGVVGMQSTRLVFNYLGSLVFEEQISLPFALKAWNESNTFNDSNLELALRATLERFIASIDTSSAM